MQRIGVKLSITIFAVFVLLLSAKGQTQFHSATSFYVGGRGAWQTSQPFSRLPSDMLDSLRKPLVDLGTNTSGVFVRFRTNSRKISARWTVTKNTVFNHMAYAGIKGLDLYTLEKDGWRFVNSGRPKDKTTETDIVSNMSGEMREYMLYLPLYDGVDELLVGVDSSATISKPLVDSPRRERPIVVYGTSITQGACASRAGMSYTSIISRRVNREVINLGFSGNAKLDYPIAQIIARVDNPSLCILDFVPNCTVEEIKEKTIPFVERIRAAHPDVPIIIIEGPIYPHSYYDNSIKDYVPAKNIALFNEYKQLRMKGFAHIYYIESERLIGNDREASVDGIHFTDLGFMRYAENLLTLTKKLIR